jgi:hypothetical protein
MAGRQGTAGCEGTGSLTDEKAETALQCGFSTLLTRKVAVSAAFCQELSGHARNSHPVDSSVRAMRISLALELDINVVEVRQETDFGQIRSSVRDPAETFANIASPV